MQQKKLSGKLLVVSHFQIAQFLQATLYKSNNLYNEEKKDVSPVSSCLLQWVKVQIKSNMECKVPAILRKVLVV